METILILGELLIDLIPGQKGLALRDVEEFHRAAGGAPANVAAAVCRLGGEAALVSKVGQDPFGEYLVREVERCGVDTRYIFRTCQANTALAFVSLDAKGNRDFCFYRKPCADLLLDEEEISPALFTNCGMLHFGSVNLVESPARRAHGKAVSMARGRGIPVSFDPNLRLSLWDSPEDCRSAVREFLPDADIVKISDNELSFLLGTEDPEAAAKQLFSMGCRLFLYTMGGDGAMAFTPAACASVPCYPVEVTDTTGAGDSFMGASLYHLVSRGISREMLAGLDAEALEELLRFASLYAAFTTTRRGAASAMATREELREFARRF